jgi:hypothetical protein
MSTRKEIKYINDAFIDFSPICNDLISIIIKYIDMRPHCDDCLLKCDNEANVRWNKNTKTFLHCCNKCSKKYSTYYFNGSPQPPQIGDIWAAFRQI